MPETLKIGSHELTVQFPYQYKERNDCSGSVWLSTGKIYISGSTDSGFAYSDSHIKQVLWHEILHVIDTIHCAGMLAKLGSAKEEMLIEGLSQGITAVLTDNPELLRLFDDKYSVTVTKYIMSEPNDAKIQQVEQE